MSTSGTSQNAESTEDIQIKPDKLTIVWSRDTRYWRMPPENSDSPAELLQVRWLQVISSTDTNKLTAGKKYKIGFNVALTSDAFGWGPDSNILVMAKIGDQRPIKKVNLLEGDRQRNVRFDIPANLCIEAPPDASSSQEQLLFQLIGIRGGWKGGLKIYHAFITEVKQ
uniref:Uncharacterized protein n=2 Tax=Davidia involucrata TaxID=16924 RepID=A0A5B7A1B0_DAVIN